MARGSLPRFSGTWSTPPAWESLPSSTRIPHGVTAWQATTYPCPLAYGATWDPELIERVGRAIGAQLPLGRCHQGLAPVLDVVRDARWGRVEECSARIPISSP